MLKIIATQKFPCSLQHCAQYAVSESENIEADRLNVGDDSMCAISHTVP